MTSIQTCFPSASLLVTILCSCCCSADTEARAFPATVPSPGDRLDIVAYCTPPAGHLSVERFREMVECGFTAGIPAEQVHDTAAVQTMLDLAHEAGIRLFVNCRELLEDPEGTAERFRTHPAAAGYFIVDEPTWGPDGWRKAQYTATPLENLDLGNIVDRIRGVDPDHPCYINLFPNFASPAQLGTETYQEHVERFLNEVPGIEFVSFDHYPVSHYRVSEAWYQNLETISQTARERGLPFWAFALTSTHYAYPPATPEALRLQMHVNLAYGAQGLQYFPYWAPNIDHWFAPVEVDGSRSFLFDEVKRLNAHLQRLAPVFRNATVTAVGHTGVREQWRPGGEANPEPWIQEELPLPPGTRRYQPESPISRLVAQGQFGAVVSTLQKGRERYLAVVNKDHSHTMVLRATLDGSREVRLRHEDGSWERLPSPHLRTAVRPGDMVVLGWSEP